MPRATDFFPPYTQSDTKEMDLRKAGKQAIIFLLGNHAQ